MNTHKRGDLVQTVHAKNFYIIRDIIGNTAFVERICDDLGNPDKTPYATVVQLHDLKSATSSIKTIIEHHQATVVQFMNILHKYSPSNEGDGQET